MAILARGNLSERPMSLIIGSLARRGFSGELVIRAAGKFHRMGWRDGAVVAAESPHPADSAGKLALTLGMINSTQALECAQLTAGHPERDELEVLGQVAHLTEDVLGRLARRVVGARAARALAPTDGDFVVTDDTATGPPIVPIDARWILYTGVRQHYTVERLEREVDGLAAVIRLREGHDLSGFGFGAAEEALLAALDSGDLTIDPLPAGLEPQIVRTVALALIATGECEIVRPGTLRAAREAPVGGGYPDPAAVAAPMAAPMAHRSGRLAPGLTAPPDLTASTSRSHPAPRTQAPPTVSRSTPRPRTQAPPMVTRTATPPRTQAPPMVSRTATEPQAIPMTSRTETGPQASPPVSMTTTSRTATGPQASPPMVSRTATGPYGGAAQVSRTMTPGSGPTRAQPMPRRRMPSADDAAAIRVLIAERVELLGADADHYTLLGVERAADANGIRAAYFELARLLHPDRLSALGIADDDRSAQRLFARINDAFTVLSTLGRRAEYDALLDAGGARAVAEKEAVATATAQAAIEAEERYRLGEMAMRRQQAEIAVHEFQRAVELKPDEPDYTTLLGWALYVAARDKVAAVPVARAHIQKALTMKKETALPHLYLGRIARMEGEDDEAARSFRRALEISPGNSEAQAELRVVDARRRSRPVSRGGLFSKLGKKP